MLERIGIAAILSIAAIIIVGLVVMRGRYDQDVARCHAAQQTILDEAALIAAGGKFPREDITDRWKKLLRGC